MLRDGLELLGCTPASAEFETETETETLRLLLYQLRPRPFVEAAEGRRRAQAMIAVKKAALGP